MNFIDDLDNWYTQSVTKNKYNKAQFLLFKNLGIYNKNGSALLSSNFIIRKDNKKTKFICVHYNSRVYFSDYDIIGMLMQVSDCKIINQILQEFKLLFNKQIDHTFDIQIESNRYNVPGLPLYEHKQIIKNEKDVDLEFQDLLILINLVIAKDFASNTAARNSKSSTDFVKKTLSKYILAIEYYVNRNSEAERILTEIGIDCELSFEENFLLREKETGKCFVENMELIEKGLNI